MILRQDLAVFPIDGFDLDKKSPDSQACHLVQEWMAKVLRNLVGVLLKGLLFILLLRIGLFGRACRLFLILVNDSDGPRVDKALVNDLGAPVVRGIWDWKGHRVLLEELLDVTDGHSHLVLEQVSSDLPKDHFLKRWRLIVRIANHVLECAWHDVTLPVLQEFEFLLVLVAVVL